MYTISKILGVVILVLAGVAAYWYLKPQHMPDSVRNLVPAFAMPKANSPMSNFKPPQY